jgi:hypothetical protein
MARATCRTVGRANIRARQSNSRGVSSPIAAPSAYRPLKAAGRFWLKAATPSRRSSVVNRRL